MFLMLLLSMRVDKGIIDEYHYSLIQVRLEYLIHIIHKNSRCIRHSKRHHKEFVMAILDSKCSLRGLELLTRI